MKYLIVGLGNIGAEYQNTRHNIGFEILDAFAEASNISFSPNRYADVATARHKGRTLILVKPNTFMNLSGKAVRYWMQHEKIPLENVLIMTDDLALPFGKIRMRKKGSDGGHNGLKNIQELLGTNQYARLRFGVGADYQKGAQINYVLGKWNETEAELLPERLKVCGSIVKSFPTIGIDRCMNEFNNK